MDARDFGNEAVATLTLREGGRQSSEPLEAHRFRLLSIWLMGTCDLGHDHARPGQASSSQEGLAEQSTRSLSCLEVARRDFVRLIARASHVTA